RARIHPEEVQLSAGAARARHRAGGQGRGVFPPVAAWLAGRSRSLLLQRTGWLHHGARSDRAVLAAYLARLEPKKSRHGRLTVQTAGNRIDLRSQGDVYGIMYTSVRKHPTPAHTESQM